MTDRDEERRRREEEERHLDAIREMHRIEEIERQRRETEFERREREAARLPAPSARPGGPGSLALSGIFYFLAPGEDVQKNAARSAAVKRFFLLLTFYLVAAVAFFVWNHLESLN